MLAIRAIQLEDHTSFDLLLEEDISAIIDGKAVKQHNTASSAWVVHDQANLGYLLSTLTCEMPMHVSQYSSLAQAWCTLADLYSSQTCTCSVNTWIALMTMKKRQLSTMDYYTKMCQYADELAATGARLHNDELIAYLLTGLDEEYNSAFTLQDMTIHSLV
jgi:hypothetical protein